MRRLKLALLWWTGSIDYQRALAIGDAERINLDGQPVEPVSEDHRALAAARIGWHEHNKACLQEAQKAEAKDTRAVEVEAEANRAKPRLSRGRP